MPWLRRCLWLGLGFTTPAYQLLVIASGIVIRYAAGVTAFDPGVRIVVAALLFLPVALLVALAIADARARSFRRTVHATIGLLAGYLAIVPCALFGVLF